MAVIKKEIRDKIVAQAHTNREFARRHKQSKVTTWKSNEDLYYGKKNKTDDSRANVDLGQMQEHIHTILSKVDSPLTFKFMKRKESQLKRVERLNSLKEYDADRDFWDIKDIAGKKQMTIYGRAVYAYSASSHRGYYPSLDNVDVYDFLVDPSAGGIDLEKARFLGRYGVIKDRSELKGNKDYIQTEVANLIGGTGNNTEENQETINKKNRVSANKHDSTQKETQDDDKFVFWEWYETYKGERYYLLLSDQGANAIDVEKLPDKFESNLWPFWTYAAYPDLTEFWTPSPADYVREIIMAQAVSINQMIDNAERVNKPVRAIDIGAIKNLAELKYRKDGYIRLNPGTNVTSAVKTMEVPSITTPIKVFETLETIKAAASGVTAGAKGVEDTDGRATIYEGNQANVADRFGFFNKSYAFGYKAFARLWEHGVREHLIKKVAIDIIGPEGVEVQDIKRSDIFRKNDTFAVMTEQSNSELLLSEQKKRSQGAFYGSLLGRPELANQKVVVEQLGKVSGVEPELLRELQDIDQYGNAELMSEAARDIENILDGKKIVQPNRMANAAYKQRFVDYMLDHEEDMDSEQTERMLQYIQSLEAVVVGNTMREAREQARKEQDALQAGQGQGGRPQLRSPGPAEPLQDVIQQNVTT